ncbi:MAG: aminotransferase class I/II-fold pyridoxal phosphate-dependent enzyme [Acidimicrobiia bacterium]|nr:aminotransferase class I/II-fold pyridoxal phosphate-dependent enzyme [Acidimicrobiia bacterium]
MSPAVPPPGDHGGDGAAIARWLGVDVAQVLDLSASLNPFPPDVAAAVVDQIDSVGRYGDIAAGEVVLAAAMGVDPGVAVLTNGGSEAIALVAAVMPRGRIDEPEFSLYRRHLHEVADDAPRWRSNPHSPSGALAAPDATAAVWDEAYWPMTTGTWTRGDHLDGAVVVGSLTKLLACPGLRLGYVLAPDPTTADALRARRPEWSVGALALAVLVEVLAAVDLRASAAAVRQARFELVRVLVTRGFDVEAADAPWVLVHSATGLRDALAARGVVVRDCTSFGLPGTVRIGIPPPAALDRLAAALDAIKKDR